MTLEVSQVSHACLLLSSKLNLGGFYSFKMLLLWESPSLSSWHHPLYNRNYLCFEGSNQCLCTHFPWCRLDVMLFLVSPTIHMLLSGFRITDCLGVFLTLYLPHKLDHFSLDWLTLCLGNMDWLHVLPLLVTVWPRYTANISKSLPHFSGWTTTKLTAAFNSVILSLGGNVKLQCHC